MQQVFLLLVEQPTAPDNPVGWLYRVVRNRAMDASRWLRRKSRRETAVAHRGEPWFEPAAGERLDAAAATEALKRLPAGAARSDRRPAVGRTFLPGDCPTGGRLDGHRQPLLSSRACRPARKVGTAMCGDQNHEEDLKRLETDLASLVPRGDRVDPGWGSVLAAKAAGRHDGWCDAGRQRRWRAEVVRAICSSAFIAAKRPIGSRPCAAGPGRHRWPP